MKIFYRIVFVISCIIFLICAVLLIKMFLPENSNMDEYKNTTQSVSSTTPSGDDIETTDVILPDNPINFKKLRKTNKDVYAWIKIPDTNIDYAVVQASKHESDLFYLDHNINKNYEFAGMIFSQKANSKNFSDPVTVLYGHNMINGSMFADLHKFKDIKFFKKHSEFYIYTPGHIYTYTIVSSYMYDDRHILNTFNFSKKKDLKKYIKSITNPHSIMSNVREDVKVSTDDKIVTLSTCTATDSQRYLVQGVLTNDELTK